MEMKTKSGKAILLFSCAAIIAAAAVRFFQYVTIMDFSTGFFKSGTEAMGLLIYILLAAAAIGFVVFAAVGKKRGNAAYFLSSDGMGESATQPLGVAFLIAALITLMSVTGYVPLEHSVAGFFENAGAVIVAIVYAALGFIMLKNTVPPVYTGHIHIFLAAYWFLETAAFFNSDLIVLNHSENLILLFGYICMTVFTLSCARFYARLETKSSRMREIISAGFTFLLSGTAVLSKAAAILFGGEAVKGISSLSGNALCMLVLSGAFLFTLFYTEKKKDIEYLAEKK